MNPAARPGDWRQAVRSQACQPPLRARLPLWTAGAVIGSVEDDFADRLSRLATGASGRLLQRCLEDGRPGWQILGDPTSSLAILATAMRNGGLAGAWRNEQLAVTTPAGNRVGTIERAAVRPLGT